MLLLSGCAPGASEEAANRESSQAAEGPARLRVEVLESYPHDPTAFTQGLLWYDGHLYESTGQYGSSTVRKVELATGRSVRMQALPDELFGEGLARMGDRLVQLTWQEGTALWWRLDGLEPAGESLYEGVGWGLCFDGRHLVMSNGSSRLAFRDPATFTVEREIEVTLGEGVVGRLNELECVDGRVYANVFTTDWIVRIDPESGAVESLIDAANLLPPAERDGADVLNGIAYDPDREVFYVTGKLWPRLFAVRFVE